MRNGSSTASADGPALRALDACRRLAHQIVGLLPAEIMPLLMDGDPLGAESFPTHTLPLTEAPDAWKQDGAIKILLKP
jgi:hypothetical protein